MKTLVIGLVVLSATLAQGAVPRFGTTFDTRLTTDELGTVAQVGATALPVTAFVDDGHGGWALDGAAFAEKGVALYADGTASGWNATLTGNSSTEKAADWTLSLRAKIGEAADQVLWFLRYGAVNNAVGCYLRTVSNDDGGLDLSFEWTLGKDYPPYVNVIFENVDTTDFHHYVIACSQSDGLRLFVDGEQKWQAASIKAYRNAEGTETQDRTPYSKSYNALWLGCVKEKSNVGTGVWTTVYDDVRFYSMNEAGDSSVPTAEELAALTETVKAVRVLPPLPAARFAVTFNDRTLSDTAGVITQVGADTLARSMFRRNDSDGYTLDAARLPDGQQGICLYEHGTTWQAGEIQPLCGVGNEVPCSYAISLVAKIAPVDGAAVCFLHYGNRGIGSVLYTVTNDAGGTDLAFTFLGGSARKAYPNILATNIDTENYHHYVLTCARANGESLRPVRLWIDNRPVDLFTKTALTVYDEDNQTTRWRSPAEKGFSGLYLAAVRGAELACTVPNGTRFGDVRFFVGEGFTDGYGPCAVDPEGIDVLHRTLMPYADRVSGAILLVR